MNLQMIQEQFNEVINYSQDEVCNANTDKLFEAWKENKSRFIDAFNGELTIELPDTVYVELPQSDKKAYFRDFVVDATCFVDTEIERENLKMFLLNQGEDALFENKVVNNYLDENGKIIIRAGAKLSRSLKHFVKDEKARDILQTRMSRIIQEGKICGKLVLSVHPLDFLSSSETTHSWHSCHALDGEYRAGNLCYMVDKHTVIAYLKSDDNKELPNFPSEVKWNSKKWRLLLYISEDNKLVVRGREYPYSNNSLLKETIGLLSKIIDTTNFNKYWEDININNVMRDAIGSQQFNDCLNSPSYEPVAIWDKSIDSAITTWDNPHLEEKYERMTIGDAVECLECGKQYISSSKSMACDDCSGFVHCHYCGDSINEDDSYYLEGGHVCYDCWDNHAVYCSHCECTYGENTNTYYVEELDCCLCQGCYDDYQEELENEEEEC